jgi:hypothetical protein
VATGICRTSFDEVYPKRCPVSESENDMAETTGQPIQPLPPEAVAGVDQRAGLCEAALDDLVAKWRIIAARRGSAGATGAIAMDFYTTQIRGINNIVDLLAFAIARLAEKD